MNAAEIQQRADAAQAAVVDAAIKQTLALVGCVCGFTTDAEWDDVQAAIQHAADACLAAHPLTLAALAGAETMTDYCQENHAMPKPPARQKVAVIAQTKDLAAQFADQLGIDRPHLIGARMATALVGLRADRFLIDAEAVLDPRFMETVRYAARKTPGASVSIVTVSDDR